MSVTFTKDKLKKDLSTPSHHVQQQQQQHNQNQSHTSKLVLGSRTSQLAMVQTEHVRERLTHIYPDMEFPIVSMSTTGDRILDVALSKIGEKALFTKELEMALSERTVDAVVHSLKDLPTTLPEGMVIAAILEREDPSDAVVVKLGLHAKSLEELPAGSVIGTSSVRRIAQLKRKFPDFVFEDIRGNLNTRLRKLDDPESSYSAIILAAAGIRRLGWHDRLTCLLPPTTSMHAVGQGALAVECRQDDTESIRFVSPLNHLPTQLRCLAERSVMRTLEGGCSVPIGVSSEWIGTSRIRLKALVASVDGKSVVEFEGEADIHGADAAEELGVHVAKEMLKRGAADVLRPIKEAR